MNFLLVLQFSGDSLADFDTVIALEEQLTEDLGDSADVDGHDVGSGETNIFILTDDPAATFLKARPTLDREGKLQAVTAAYRSVRGERYTILWPEGAQSEFKVI